MTSENPRGCIPLGARYTLTPREMVFASEIAHRRVQENSHANTTIMTFAKNKSDFHCHYQGVLGELVFGRLLERALYIDRGTQTKGLEDTHCRNVTNDTYDATLPDGRKVDVKGTTATQQLVVGNWKRKTSQSVVYAMISLLDVYDPTLAEIIPAGFSMACTGVFQGSIDASSFWRLCQPYTVGGNSDSASVASIRQPTLAETLQRPVRDTQSQLSYLTTTHLLPLTL